MEIMEIKGLKKHYRQGSNVVYALDGVDLSVEKGEFITILGTSGSGKSTLLYMLSGLDYPTKGSIIVDGVELTRLSQEQLAMFRRSNVGFVFQDYNLIPILNVYENIILPLELGGGTVDKIYIEEIISILGLSDKKDSLPNMLSGGQQQRVAIARALAIKPSIVLADEPTGNLDWKTSNEVIDLLKMMAVKFTQTVILVTHNEKITEAADRKIYIQDGKIIKDERNRTDSL